MTPSQEEEIPANRDDRLIDAARLQIHGAADSTSSAEALSRGTAGKDTVTSQETDRTAMSIRKASLVGVPPFKRIAQYHITRRIASGAMGTVFEATQENPRRTVAIKVMKQGIASRRALRRFEDESQILARLNHPGIAKVYEAGWHEENDTRVPFFALEYIPHAAPIIDFADHRQLRIADRIRLFVSVCHAIHHGHQRGVIHRDIKPGNILVDSGGQVKVIDFGVARSTDADLNLTSLQTVVGEIVGTLKYMSPEQCHADPHDLDIRTDIYSLGVVLFELLSGRAPYDLSTTPFVSIPKLICEEPPARLGAIDRALRGDLEIIVHKALEKDRGHRYQSALGLAEDLERFLAYEPILARPPSAVYRFRRLLRRRRTPLTAATLLVVLGVVVAAANIRLGLVRKENRRLANEVAMLAASAPCLDFRNTPVPRTRVLNLCNQVLAADARNAKALALRARINLFRGDNDEAGKDCAAALEIEPENTLAERTCALIEMNKGHFEAARELYEAALSDYALTNDLPRDFHNRARLRRLAGEYQEAMTDHHRAIALAPSYGKVHKGRAVTRYMRGDLPGAIEDFTRAASLPGNRAVECNQYLWEIYALRGKPGDRAKAKEALRRAAAVAGDPRAKGMLDVLRGRRDAETHLASLRPPGDKAQAHYYLGVKALVEQKPQVAIGHFRKADDPSLKGYVEYDLARWHLARLKKE